MDIGTNLPSLNPVLLDRFRNDLKPYDPETEPIEPLSLADDENVMIFKTNDPTVAIVLINNDTYPDLLSSSADLINYRKFKPIIIETRNRLAMMLNQCVTNGKLIGDPTWSVIVNFFILDYFCRKNFTLVSADIIIDLSNKMIEYRKDSVTLKSFKKSFSKYVNNRTGNNAAFTLCHYKKQEIFLKYY